MPAAPGEEKLRALLAALDKAYNQDNESPSWDGAGALRHTFYTRALRWIVTVDPAYESIIQYGSAYMGRTNAVSSVEHAIALAADSIPEGTAHSPAALPYVAPAASASAPAAAPATDMPEHLRGAYTVNIPALRTTVRNMGRDLLNCITVQTVRDREEKKAGGKDGIAIIKMWAKWIEDNKHDVTYDPALQLIMNAHLTTGLAVPDTTHFARKRGMYEAVNQALSAAVRVPDATIAARYITMVRACSAELKSGLQAILRADPPDSSDILESTCSRIEEALGEVEADELQAAIDGYDGKSLLNKRDPRKDRRGGDRRDGRDRERSGSEQPPTETKPDSPCEKCTIAGKTGDLHHWHNKCPNFDTFALARAAAKAIDR